MLSKEAVRKAVRGSAWSIGLALFGAVVGGLFSGWLMWKEIVADTEPMGHVIVPSAKLFLATVRGVVVGGVCGCFIVPLVLLIRWLTLRVAVAICRRHRRESSVLRGADVGFDANS